MAEIKVRIGVASEKCVFTTLRNIHDFMQSEEQTKQVKHCYINVYATCIKRRINDAHRKSRETLI